MTVLYFELRGEREKRRDPMPLGLFLCFFLGGGHLPQTFGIRSAKQTLVVSFATQVRACILSDRNIFCTLGERQQRRGLMPLGLFLFPWFFFFWWSLSPHFRSAKKYLPVIFVRLAFIRQNFMKVGVENHWRLNGIKIPSMRARTEMLTCLASHRFNPVIQLLIVIFTT